MSPGEATHPKPPGLPLGESDFQSLRRQALRYVDKSWLVAEVIHGGKVQLYTRPRRFGKTLALSMLRCFFERPSISQQQEDRSDLFAGLAISQPEHGKDCRQHQQRYPVVALSFRDVKEPNWERCAKALRQVLVNELLRLQDWGYLAELQGPRHEELCRWLNGQTPMEDLAPLLRDLSSWLAQQSGEPAVILIDEYDTPLHSAHVHGYYEQAVGFFRNLLTGGLKDNPHLYRGVLTGILRVAKEGLFSGLNNLEVNTVLSSRGADAFGFTEPEVEKLAQEYGAAADMEGIRAWYNGYRFGGGLCGEPITVYNPWSVLSYLHNPDDGFKPHWVNTSDNALLKEMLTSQGYRIEQELLALLQGGTIRKPLYEFLSLQSFARQHDALWSFLLMAGYLRREGPAQAPAEAATEATQATQALQPPQALQSLQTPQALETLRIPNHEVALSYQESFLRWLEEGADTTGEEVQRWCQALVRGEQEFAQAGLQELFRNVMSYHDRSPQTPESVYQAFVLGLLVNLRETHRVRSNREAGFGRYDVIVTPKAPGGPGVVLEFKVIDLAEELVVNQALERGIAQIHSKGYAAELSEVGAVPQHAIAIACCGKQVWLRVEALSPQGSDTSH